MSDGGNEHDARTGDELERQHAARLALEAKVWAEMQADVAAFYAHIQLPEVMEATLRGLRASPAEKMRAALASLRVSDHTDEA